MNFSIWFVMAVDRGELNSIFFKQVMFLSKFVVLLRDGKVGSCHCQIDEYDGWCLFKCWIMFVVFSDLYYNPTNPADSSLTTTRCFCHRVAQMFPNKLLRF